MTKIPLWLNAMIYLDCGCLDESDVCNIIDYGDDTAYARD